MFKTRLTSILVTIGMIFGALVAVSAPASAASADATLSSLRANGAQYRTTDLNPGFSSDRTWYQIASTRRDVSFSANSTDEGATIHVQYLGKDEVLSNGGNITLNLPVAVTPITFHVVSSDGTATKDYVVWAQIGVLLQPQLLSMSQTSGGTLGGEHIVFRVKNAQMYLWNYNIYCSMEFKWVFADGTTSNFGGTVESVDNNGVGLVYTQVSTWGSNWHLGKADLRVDNYCGNTYDDSLGWTNFRSSNLYKDAYEFKELKLDTPSIPDTAFSPFGRFSLSGLGINNGADIFGFMVDPAYPEEHIYFWSNGWINNTTASYYFDGPYDKNWNWTFDRWKTPGKKMFYILKCGTDWNGPKGCWRSDDSWHPAPISELTAQGNLLYSAEVNYRPNLPTNVTVSPAKGSVNGGNKIRFRGHDLKDLLKETPIFKIGGQTVTDVRQIEYGDGQIADSMDVYEGVVPAATSPGVVPITVTNHWGETTLGVKYTYSDKPQITAVSPATVANSGGALITITGKNFGISGTPAVTIDGVKSDCVTRVSDTKVIAMVPASTVTGQVDVNMISGAGGGSPDLPFKLNLAAATTLPTVTKVSPSSVAIGGGDEVTITGTNFGSAGTVGVMVGANCAKVTASTSTSITFEVPSGDAAGATDIMVGTTTGSVVKVGGITYTPTPGVSSVTPSTIASYATGDNAKAIITGAGFGTAGKIKIGSAAAINYTATDGGTKISGVVIPTTTTGTISILITPTGSTSSFTTSVKVRPPVATYFGTNPHSQYYEWSQGWYDYRWAAPVVGRTTGNENYLIEGKDFGDSGTVKFGTTSATIVSWTDTAVVFTAPALAIGSYDVTLTPASGGGKVLLEKAYSVLAEAPVGPTLTKTAATVDNGRENAQHTFDGEADVSDVFEITGTYLTGTDSGASTKVTITDGDQKYKITPISVTATKIRFHAPRGISPIRWVSVTVTTNVGEFHQDHGILYVGNVPQPVVFSPGRGLCSKDAIGVYTPTGMNLTGPDGFGDSGTVTIGGVTIPSSAVTWTKGAISVNFANITGNFTTQWGYQSVTFTPTDTALIPRTFGFSCGVDTTVVTKLNNSTADLTINAGTAYTASATMNNILPGTTGYTAAADGYQYVKASDYVQYGFQRNVNAGLPIAAGEYYVRVALTSSAYDTNKYVYVGWDNAAVHLTITGQPVTFTPKLTSGAGTEITYSGPLGDGTDGSSNDIGYTKTATNDAVTKVYYEYKEHTCLDNSNVGWSSGLPTGVAISSKYCGGDDSSVSSWDIRVRSFDMIVNGVNKNIYYLPTYNIFNLKIKKKGLTLTKITAEKPYDGKTEIVLGEIGVTGAVNGESPTLDGNLSKGNFADATVGNAKAITLGGPIVLSGSYNNNYELTNPNYVFTGAIKKANAQLRLTSAVPSVIMTNAAPFEVTATVKDINTGQAPIAEAGVAPVVITSGSPSICSISGTTVTPIKAGDCIINATQAASVNYNAAKSYNDDSATVESITVKIFAAPKAVQIVADDVTIAKGDSFNTSSQAIGLVDGDSLNTVQYDIYQGTTKLDADPTEPGTYKIVPRDATLQAADMAAYQPTFKYVSGKLVITQVPPVVTKLSQQHGPEKGGTTMTLTGTNLDDVTSIVWGNLTIRKPDFVANGDGTEITMKIPAGTGQVDIVLRAGAAEAAATYLYDAPVVPPVVAPLELNLKLALEIGTKLVGQKVTIKGGGLKPFSDYVLELHSDTVVIYQGVADKNGNFLQTLKLAGNACVPAGRHSFKLTGINPDGSPNTDEAFFNLGADCIVGTGFAEKTVVGDKVTWTLSGFLFKYRDAALTGDASKSLNSLLKLIKGAKKVTISGYTETDTKSAAIKKSNLKLAKDRCQSVMDYLISKGLKAKYKLIGKGGVDPVSITDQSKNRRVVIEATF